MRRKRPSLVGIGAAVAEQVVGRHVALHARECLAEIVGVGESAPAGIGGQRRQRVLRRRELIELLLHATSGEERLAAAAGLSSHRRRGRRPGVRACRPDRWRRSPRTAALIAERSSTWLSWPLRCMPALK